MPSAVPTASRVSESRKTKPDKREAKALESKQSLHQRPTQSIRHKRTAEQSERQVVGGRHSSCYSGCLRITQRGLKPRPVFMTVTFRC